MKYTVLVNLEYCDGLFETKSEAIGYANGLVREVYKIPEGIAANFDEDDWWQQRDNANIRPVKIYTINSLS